MVLHHQQLKDADAIPILAADDTPLLYHQDGHDTADAVHVFPSRRKRHSGHTEGSNNNNSSSGVARFVSRRRGRSVPCDTSAGGHMANNNSSSSNEYGDPQLAAVSRTRAGSVGSALAGSRAARLADGDAILGDNFGATGGGRRRAATSSILNHFRRRQKEHEHAQNEYRDPDNQAAGRRRKVHFKTTLHAEVMPNPFASQPTYDELLFNVGGLYQTLSFLHDPFPQDDPTNSSTDSSSQGLLDDDLHQPPPERSMQLMIAEFLYRSAVYLGYPNDSKPWIPGFRETKRFSVNDVKRWRRLAHHDWNKEEEQFRAAVLVNQQYNHHSRHRRKTSSGIGFRATVSGWLQQRKRRHSAPAKMSLSCPPPVSTSADLSLLVTIANSCVYCGAFQFTARDVLALCNVDIETQVTTATTRSV